MNRQTLRDCPRRRVLVPASSSTSISFTLRASSGPSGQSGEGRPSRCRGRGFQRGGCLSSQAPPGARQMQPVELDVGGNLDSLSEPWRFKAAGPQERPRAAMGQARNPASPASRPALRQRLSVRRHLPGARGRRALALPPRHRHDATPSRRDPAQRRRPHAVPLLDRAGWHTTAKLEVPANITPDLLAFPRARTEPGRERLGVLAQQLAVEPRLRHLRRGSSPPPATPGATSKPTPKESPNRHAKVDAYRS